MDAFVRILGVFLSIPILSHGSGTLYNHVLGGAFFRLFFFFPHSSFTWRDISGSRYPILTSHLRYVSGRMNGWMEYILHGRETFEVLAVH